MVTSPAILREELWKKDWDIIHGAGIRQTYGENGGPGSLSHTPRNVPMLEAICRDVEELAPHAMMINSTNPEARICTFFHRYTKLRFVGLCHQIYAGYGCVIRMLGIPHKDLDIKAARASTTSPGCPTSGTSAPGKSCIRGSSKRST